MNQLRPARLARGAFARIAAAQPAAPPAFRIALLSQRNGLNGLIGGTTAIGGLGAVGAFGGQRRNLSLGSWTPSWEWIGLGKKDIPAGDVVAAKADETAAAAQQAAQAAPDAVQATQAVSDAVSAATDSVAATATDLATSIVPPSAEAAAALLSNAEFSGFPHSVWSLAGLAERYLDLIHASTGLPWWASIVIGTLIFRLAAGYVIMPGVQRGAAKMANATPIIRPLAERAAQAKKQGNKDEMMRASQDMAAKYKELGISPVSTVLPMLIQAPLFIGMFMGLRAMSEMPFPGFQDGGLWWFTDLSTADPTMVLPVVAIGLQLVINELGGEIANPGAMKPGMKNAMRFIGLMMFFTLKSFPAAFFVYFTANNFASLLQILLFRSPAVRAHFKIPKIVRYTVPGAYAEQGQRMAGMVETWRMLQKVDGK